MLFHGESTISDNADGVLSDLLLNDCYQKNKKEKTILSHLLQVPKTLSHWLECRFKELLSEGAFNNNETLGEKTCSRMTVSTGNVHYTIIIQ